MYLHHPQIVSVLTRVCQIRLLARKVSKELLRQPRFFQHLHITLRHLVRELEYGQQASKPFFTCILSQIALNYLVRLRRNEISSS